MRVIRLAAAIASTISSGAPAGAVTVRRSVFIAALAGGTHEKPPGEAAASTTASSTPISTAASAAIATVRPRTGRVDFTVRYLGFAFQSASEVSCRARAGKTCATPCLERPAIRPHYLVPPVAWARDPGDSAVYDALQPRLGAEVAVILRPPAARYPARPASAPPMYRQPRAELERPRRRGPRRASPRAAAPR